MKKKHIFITIMSVFLFAQTVLSQGGKNDPHPADGSASDWDMRNQQKTQQTQRYYNDDWNGKPSARYKPRQLSEEEKEKIAEAGENTESIRLMLLPPADYLLKYADFISKKNTGIIRLFTDISCDKGKTISIEELARCADAVPITGNGSLYSFRGNKHSFSAPDWWDIHFADKKFAVGNDTVQVLIADIGDVDLKSVDSKSGAIKFLENYKPKTSLSEIKEQNRILERGIGANNFIFTNSTLAKLNSTYVLRSIAYFLKGKNNFENLSKGVDITTVFKVVGREKDGSLIIIWKQLNSEKPRKEIE